MVSKKNHRTVTVLSEYDYIFLERLAKNLNRTCKKKWSVSKLIKLYIENEILQFTENKFKQLEKLGGVK